MNMVKNHLKRINAPKTWKIERKSSKWVMHPNPGAHTLPDCISLSTIFKEVLHIADTSRQVRTILRSKEVQVNGRRRIDPHDAVGIMDVLAIPELKEQFRMLVDRFGQLSLRKIPAGESGMQLCKITGKRTLSGGKVQFSLSGGRTMLGKGEYKVGDSLLLDVPAQSVKDHIPFDKGAAVFFTGGKHVGSVGTLTDFTSSTVAFTPLGKKGEHYTTAKRYAFVVGKDKPLVSLGAEVAA